MKQTDVSYHSKGGSSRAKNLSPEERSAIAKIAAEERWNLPAAEHYGILKLGETDVPCAIVKIGDKIHRLVTQREVVGLLTGNVKGGLGRYFNAKQLTDFVPEKFKSQNLDDTIIKFTVKGKKAHGYDAEDIVDICSMYLDARKSKVSLLPSQLLLAEKAEIIIRALAKTGIIALIDEATGYQTFREKDALQEYLNTVIRKELATWIIRFPNDFFMQIYRLKGWTYDPKNHKRPQIIGKYINDLVYARLGPGIKEQLEKQNPITDLGYRKTRHHQWLTDDVGHPKLAQHLHTLTKLMEISEDWKQFESLAHKAFPITNPDQLKFLI